ncbi:glycoside hydrolase family 99-like domain-containing protein [Lysobacter sp. LF1]|uniref:Glycoside hydrolase family 99-like domain-containing protein n=1 Tax=Lysobacter stagni TaxID=3045172 RepID=A0ABT6XF36_9GAMM|nr:glycoside hydrolase family 99-like domain-containing protein [Lysobacter sp. LF1]MDI9238748.1 glycoside hydrolase family 99-like domain-containing protein [Lysobacter sp. LF1]
MTSRLQEGLRTAVFNGLRAAFRITPMPERMRDRLRQSYLERFADTLPQGPRGKKADTTKAAHRPRARSDAPALGHVPRRQEPLPSPLPATLVAFYLPQFHTIAENDAWWGKGFTEWRNVSRALPQFEGHAQPRLPGDLGFYDLRNPHVMRDQAALAREYGIGAFCFYYYWFGGKTLLEAPLQQWLQDDSIDLPFCLCWANENWSRRWDGRADDILIGQQHSAEDDLAFIAHIAPYLRDRRYLRVDGKPLLLVYRPGLLPEPKATAARWRAWCNEHGIGEIFIAYTQSFDRADPTDYGFDAAVEFPPNLATPANITADQQLINPDFRGQVLDWRELANDYRQRPLPGYRLFPGVNCGWDNEARRPGAGRTYLHSAPRRYRDWLGDTIHRRLAGRPASDRLVFVNAWNEWAEGAVLEPDARLGHAWLQATRDALTRSVTPTSTDTTLLRPCLVVHAWYPDVLDEIIGMLVSGAHRFRVIVTTSAEKVAQVRAMIDKHGIEAEIEAVENRGRDILPFLRVADRLLNEGEQLVLKLHTKKSPHRHDGDAWRSQLIGHLLSPSRVDGIVRAYREDSGLGLVAPEGHVQPLGFYWGANEGNVRYLASRLGIAAPEVDSDDFISGSMFWARLEALRPLLDAHLDDWEFEAEAGQVDGTFAHAIERVFALAARDAGYRVRSAAGVCGEPEPPASQPYAFARRG